jgi:hypothetical protein
MLRHAYLVPCYAAPHGCHSSLSMLSRTPCILSVNPEKVSSSSPPPTPCVVTHTAPGGCQAGCPDTPPMAHR